MVDGTTNWEQDPTMASPRKEDTYFASREAKDCASSLMAKSQSFFNMLRANAYLEKLQRMWRFYYGAFDNSMGFDHRITFSGEQGELVRLAVNHFRNLAQHILVMVTNNRPIMEARAINSDHKSMAQTYLANGILDYYMREKRLEDYLKDATEMAIVLGAGFIKMEWNATAGEAFDTDPDTNEIIYEGEMEFSVLSPFDVVVDGTRETWNNDWLLTRSFQNRYNLIAKYPELADKIKGVPGKYQSTVYRLAVFSNDDTDDIPVYEFYHKRTEALPEGRYILFLADDIILLDAKMPYRSIPIFRISPSTIMGTPYGYSPMFDIFPIQEGINSLYSTIMTNQNAFGVQNLFVPRGADIAVNQLEGGMNIIEANAQPVPLNLTQTPAEVFKFLEMLIQAAETISGVSSVSRGNPEASLKSGTALALVQSMSLQYISGLQQSYVKLVEDVGTNLINILKDFAATPKTIAVVGKNNRSLLKEFTGEKISAINRVVVDIGNPLSRTVAGRVQMAEQLLQMKLLRTPEQYFQVINTGRLDVAFEGDTNLLLLVRLENETMMEGEKVLVAPLDRHRIHILEHSNVISDPELRKNPELLKLVHDHIMEHIDHLKTMPPEILAIIGEQSLAPPQEQGMPPGEGAPQSFPSMLPQPSADSLQGSPMASMTAAEQGAPSLRDQITGEATPQTAKMPNFPKPPQPFKEMPVLASDLAPPAR